MVNDVPFISARVPAVSWERVAWGEPLGGRAYGATVEMWNGSVLKCRLGEAEIGLEVAPAMRLSIRTARLVSITRAQSSPPAAARVRDNRQHKRPGEWFTCTGPHRDRRDTP